MESEMRCITKSSVIAIVAMAITLASCSNTSDPLPPLVVPTAYDSAQYTANTIADYKLRSDIITLTNLMKTGRVAGTTVDAAALTAEYAPIRPLTGSYYAPLVDTYLATLARVSGKLHNWQASPEAPDAGGVYGGYLFDEYGVEMEQLVEKGLFTASLYLQATSVMSAPLTPASVDRIVALFGANPAFPNTDRAAVNADRFSAAYAARRDQNDGKGFYTQFRDQAIRLQAAVKAGANYATDRDAAAAAIRDIWERAIMATAINYTYGMVDGLSATTVTEASRGSAMHAFGECVGFLHGWKAIPQSMRRITDTQIDAILLLLNVPANGTWTPQVFWQNPVSSLSRVLEARNSIRAIYGFSDTEMESFKSNWVNAQNRR